MTFQVILIAIIQMPIINCPGKYKQYKCQALKTHFQYVTYRNMCLIIQAVKKIMEFYHTPKSVTRVLHSTSCNKSSKSTLRYFFPICDFN